MLFLLASLQIADATDVHIGIKCLMCLHLPGEIVLALVTEGVNGLQLPHSRIMFHVQCGIFLPAVHRLSKQLS